jgi:SARP family transcriptional regulator, regulator of embCAB operon
LRLRVLGPLHIGDAAGRSCTPRAFKLRVLLGILLIEHNRVISTQHLMDELWEGSPPKTARTAMQVYISNLRKLFQDACISPRVAEIVTCPPGYSIEVDDQEFDLPCFEQGLKYARRAEDQGELDIASQLISQALALWRGPALYDVRSNSALEAEARRLDELRMAAYERRLLIDLQRGLDSDLIGELYALTAEYPLREKLYEYLIIALHNQGRPADALQAYDTIRTAMRDQLGLEPGPGLRELQKIVLSRGSVRWTHAAQVEHAHQARLHAWWGGTMGRCTPGFNHPPTLSRTTVQASSE